MVSFLKNKLVLKFVLFLAIALLATGLDFVTHEQLNPFFDDDTSRPIGYYVAKVFAFVVAFIAVDFFYKPIERALVPLTRLLPILDSRAFIYAITGTLYFAVYYILVAPAFVLPLSSIILTGLHAVFIFVSAKVFGVK